MALRVEEGTLVRATDRTGFLARAVALRVARAGFGGVELANTDWPLRWVTPAVDPSTRAAMDPWRAGAGAEAVWRAGAVERCRAGAELRAGARVVPRTAPLVVADADWLGADAGA